jgi:MFS family permease
MDTKEKKIIRLTAASHGLVHLYEGVLPPLIPLLIGEFSTDYFHLGVIVTIFSYAFGLGSLPAGYLADRIGPRRLVSAYLLGAGLAAMAVWFADSLWSYGIVMGFIGLFCSTYHPASNTLISHAVREKGRAFGIHGIAGSLGVALVPVVSAWMGSAMGWKAPHVVFGFFGLAVGIYSLSIPGAPVAPAQANAGGGKDSGSKTISYLNLSIFFAASIVQGVTYKGIMTFLPAYMGENVRLSFLRLDTVALGGTVATLALLSGAVGQYLSGRLVDRFRAEGLYLGALLIGTLWVFVMAATSNLVLVAAAVLYAFFYFATQPIQNYLISSYLPKHRQGLGYGLHFFLSFGVGSTAAAVAGYMADRFGLQSVFYLMGLCFALTSILIGTLLVRVRGR